MFAHIVLSTLLRPVLKYLGPTVCLQHTKDMISYQDSTLCFDLVSMPFAEMC